MKNNTDTPESQVLLQALLTTEDGSVNYNQILDIITYTFCTIGIVLNFFAFGILRRKATIGVLLIKLILISDGLVCVFYLLNQTWSDVIVKYYPKLTMDFYLNRNTIPTHISSTLRNLAIIAISVSNWYIVIMIAHRCVSIFVSPSRSRLDRTLWVFAQKPFNLWIAYAICWLCGILQAFLLPFRSPIIFDVFMYVLPLTLVSVFSIALLVKLRKIHKNSEAINAPSLCCISFHGATRSHKLDSDETFAPTRPGTLSADKESPLSDEIRVNRFNKVSGEPLNTNVRPTPVTERRKTYYRITITILSMAISFLILDSMQLIDLLIRIPWEKFLGGFNQATANGTYIDNYVTEVKSQLKQHIMSIVKNTCTLGKTLVNFLILCAHSRHFRAMVAVKFRRFRRCFRIFKYRYSRSINSHFHNRNLWFIPSIRRNTILKKRKDLDGLNPSNPCILHPAKKKSKRAKFITPKKKSSNSSGNSLTHSLFRQKPRDDEGYVVHKFRKSLRKSDLPQIYGLAKNTDSGRISLQLNQQSRYLIQEKYPSVAMIKDNTMLESSRDDSHATNEMSSSLYQPTLNLGAERGTESDSEKSICTTCECRSVSSSSDCLSNASNLTYPGAFRAHCCDCQRAKFSEADTKPRCCTKK